MAANESTAIQLNYRVGQALVNIYADDAQEATELNKWVFDNGDEIAKTQAFLDAMYSASAPGGGQVQSLPQQAVQQQRVPQQAPPQQQAPRGDGGQCNHGPRVFKDGQGKRGYWSAWMCPSRVDGCEPVWNR